MRFNRAAVCGLLLPALAIGVAACGDNNKSSSGGGGGSTAAGTTLTIYSSLPLQGTSRGQSQAVINGEKLALEEVGSKVGTFKLKYVSLDDSTAQNPGTADEGKTAQNARQAVRDKSTIFYLGEFNSGGTKVSLPILNKAGIPQISPSNTYIGLTTNEPGSEPGEPDKYYPTGTRTYARVVPRDKIQGAALVSVMKEDGCKTVTLWNDKSTYGAGLARNIKQSAEGAGLTIENEQGTDKNSPNYRSIASKIKSDCFVFSGVTGENGVQVFKDVAKAAPNAKLYGPDGVTEESFSNPKKGGIPASVGARTKTTVATLGVKDLPAAAPVLEKYKAKYHTQTVDPYGIYGYETMSLALDVLKRAGAKANDRKAVVAALFQTKDKDSVLGKYSIDANGDTSLTDYGLYVIKDGIPTYSKKIVAATG
ncbi:MAG: branched-chain amino acid transport system substrate-binding protein [Solirubrobacteraceae bacterium]|nr:branched-chain amino acid transport system substrate-binding protein [Solirubrobacteraceae bacterium]